MVGNSPPRHRHDGTSPLPLGMDYSPAPSRWMGSHSAWPHDPRTGWSYCVMIPSWTVPPDANAAESHLTSPIVFYRVQVGIQSPGGVSSLRKVLRRFSDFLKLHAAVKRAFPKKQLPLAPPKNSMLWMSAKDTHLEERRLALLDWLAKLLGDIDISRSAPVAAFFELEAAARAAMQAIKEAQVSSAAFEPSLKSGLSSGGTPSITSEPELQNEMSGNLHEGSMKKGFETKAEALDSEKQLDALMDMNHKLNASSFHPSLVEEADLTIGEASESVALKSQPSPPVTTEEERAWHGRRPSLDSIGSEISSAKGSDFSVAATGDMHSEILSWDIMHNSGSQSSEHLSTLSADTLKNVHASAPLDQRGNVKRVLANLQRRLNMAKTDMEDMIIRLNQETAVKEFLAAKVRDLEGEVDSTRRKGKEMLQRAMSMEQDNVNNLQWELEEARASMLSADEQILALMESRSQAEEKQKLAEVERAKAWSEVIELKEKLESYQKDRESSEARGRAEVKVLAREIKALRKSQPELKEKLEAALKERAKLEAMIESDSQQQEQQRLSRAKFLHEVGTLRKRLQECSMESLARQEDKSIMKSPAMKDVMDLLMTSENRIGMLAAEAQLLAEEKDEDRMLFESVQKKDILPNGSPTGSNVTKPHGSSAQDLGGESAFRKMLSEIFLDNIQLYKVVNSMTLNATVMDANQEKGGLEESPIKKSLSVLNRFL